MTYTFFLRNNVIKKSVFFQYLFDNSVVVESEYVYAFTLRVAILRFFDIS